MTKIIGLTGGIGSGKTTIAKYFAEKGIPVYIADDEAKKILIHPNGNIIVTGYGNNKSVGNDFWTMALTPTGDTLWTNLHNSSATNLYDEANDMAIDSNGNIFVVGDSDQRLVVGTRDGDLNVFALRTVQAGDC